MTFNPYLLAGELDFARSLDGDGESSKSGLARVDQDLVVGHRDGLALSGTGDHHLGAVAHLALVHLQIERSNFFTETGNQLEWGAQNANTSD